MRPPLRYRGAITALVAAGATIAVALIYREAAGSYFVEDDFHWLQRGRRFEWAALLDLDRFDHFYRPTIEVYFAAAHRLAGCTALPLHLASLGIHVLNTLVLFAFAWRLTGRAAFAVATAALFVPQPGFVEAVAWVAAITDLLPALWYLLTLLLHLIFLQSRSPLAYTGALLSFAACLLTHESSATLLPMMLVVEGFLWTEGTRSDQPLRRVVVRYLPHALLLIGFLVVAYTVNSRSYLVREGYYALGLHAFPNALHYLVALYVGKRSAIDYVLIGTAIAAVVLRGTPRMRLCLVWILLSMLPVLFFTWGIASRYLYVPGAGFALLLAETLRVIQHHAASRLPRRVVQMGLVLLVTVLATRFALFAYEGADGFRERTRASERMAAAIRSSSLSTPADGTVYLRASDVEGVPDIYHDALAEEALCRADVSVVIR